MKTFKALIVVTLASAVGLASAQRVIIGHQNMTPNVGLQTVNQGGMLALQNDLAAAIVSMDKALPIYDGYRVKSMHQAREALIVVDRFLLGGKASTRGQIGAKDTIGSKSAKGRYNGAQIAASQQFMNAGLQYLNAALNDLTVATNGAPQKRGQKVAADIRTAIADAGTAIGLHATKM